MDSYRRLREDELDLLRGMIKKRNTKRSNPQITRLRCAIYARKSQEDTKDTSLSTQIVYCKSLIDGCDLLEHTLTYQEDNKSGMWASRPQFQAMIKAIQEKEVDVVIVYKWDRFARKSSDAQNYYADVVEAGGTVIAGDSVVVVNSASTLYMQQMMWANSEYQARSTAERTIDIMINKSKDGMYLSGAAPYGYDKEAGTNKLIINIDESMIVHDIFTQLSQGLSISSVVSNLYNSGYKTRAGKCFTKTAVDYIAHNQVYLGKLVYNKYGGKKKSKRILQQDYEEVIVDNAHAAIIDEDTFNIVQEKLDTKKVVRVKDVGYVYLLSGMIRCKSCGSLMVGESQKSRTQQVIATFLSM